MFDCLSRKKYFTIKKKPLKNNSVEHIFFCTLLTPRMGVFTDLCCGAQMLWIKKENVAASQHALHVAPARTLRSERGAHESKVEVRLLPGAASLLCVRQEEQI